ncbi:MAG: hypothetical protein PHV68_00990 [Candidatus Gastranaerophilales bacterium]|nr:hypothetical protein [Candidatus Gastranaerophilales bacterium]
MKKFVTYFQKKIFIASFFMILSFLYPQNAYCFDTITAIETTVDYTARVACFTVKWTGKGVIWGVKTTAKGLAWSTKKIFNLADKGIDKLQEPKDYPVYNQNSNAPLPPLPELPEYKGTPTNL